MTLHLCSRCGYASGPDSTGHDCTTPAEGPLLRWELQGPLEWCALDSRGRCRGFFGTDADETSDIDCFRIDIGDDDDWGRIRFPTNCDSDSARRAWAERVLTAAIGARWER